VAITVVDKIHCEVAAMAINNKELIISPAARFLLCTAVKDLREPCYPDLVVAHTGL
jgi:hypothetical protein